MYRFVCACVRACLVCVCVRTRMRACVGACIGSGNKHSHKCAGRFANGQQPCSFKLGYYFRGIDQHASKAKANAEAAEARQHRQADGLAAALIDGMQAKAKQAFGKKNVDRARQSNMVKAATVKQHRSQCCGVPAHLMVAASMTAGATAILGIFVALPLYVYLDRLPRMQC